MLSKCALFQKQTQFIVTHTQAHNAHANISLKASEVLRILGQYKVMGKKWQSSVTRPLTGSARCRAQAHWCQWSRECCASVQVHLFTWARANTSLRPRLWYRLCWGREQYLIWHLLSQWRCSVGRQQWRGRLEDGRNRFACELHLLLNTDAAGRVLLRYSNAESERASVSDERGMRHTCEAIFLSFRLQRKSSPSII